MDFQVRPIQDSAQKWAEGRPILRGIGSILLVVGFTLLALGLYGSVQKYRRISRWVSVDATVLDFKVLHEPCGRASNCYRASFTFQYEFQGQKLVGWAQSDHTGSYSSELSDWMAYQPGAHQQIRYNPAQPQEITVDNLDVRSFREPLKLGGWGAGLLFIGLLLKR